MSFYKMERGWMDSDMFGDAPYSDRDAWSWMVGEARWEDGFIALGGSPMPVKRGQFYASVRFMAEKFTWSKDRVSRFLKRLEKWSSIRVETATGQNLITICNYEEYQSTKDTPKDSNKDGVKDTTKDTPKDKQEEIQEIQEGEEDRDSSSREIPELHEHFENFWRTYPKQRIGRQAKAKTAYRNAVTRATPEEIHRGLLAYAGSDEVARGFAKGAAAWLNDDRWKSDYTKGKQNANTSNNQFNAAKLSKSARARNALFADFEPVESG